MFDTADWDNSHWIVPLGASDHPSREHDADQAPIWAQVDLIPMTYTWAAMRLELSLISVSDPSRQDTVSFVSLVSYVPVVLIRRSP